MRIATAVLGCLAMVACSPPVVAPDAGVMVMPTCPALTGAVVSHTTDISTAETWAGDGTLHVIDFGITVRPGGTLTLEPCATVQVGAGLIWSVAGDVAMNKPAKLISNGTADRPVTISRKNAAQAWGQLRALNPLSTMEFSHTTIRGGGDASTSMLILTGASDLLSVQPVLKAANLTLENAGARALTLERGAAFIADSTALTITGGGTPTASVGGDLDLTPRAANTLPTTVNITGNAQNLIRLSDGSLIIERDVTLRDVGVPYHFYFDRVRVHSSTGTPKLTLQAGVVAQFDDYLMIGSDGSTPDLNQPGVLVAAGTVAKPVVFTTHKPTNAAGDWPGVWLRNAAGSTLTNVRIEASGGFNGISSSNCKPNNSNDYAGLNLGWGDNNYIPNASDFSGVVIANGSSHGINAMWTSAGFGPDVTAGFTFSGIAGCKQTKNRRTTGCGTEAGCLVP